MLLEQTLDKLTQMKLFGMAEGLRNRMARADHAELPVADIIGLVVDDEWTRREKRKSESLLRTAAFKEAACIEDLNYRSSRNLKRAQVAELTRYAWLTAKQNLVITGATGAGKSYLSQAIGHRACRDGHSVMYFRMSKFVSTVKLARAEGSYMNFLKRLMRTRLLVLDDFGIDLLDEQSIRDLLEILDDRHGVGSTMVTSQLPVAHWHEYLGGGMVADSICDRLLSNSLRIELEAKESMRKKEEPLTEVEKIPHDNK
jgi:DNA replication protein DnaC